MADDEEDNEGVLDVASIVAGGKMNEYLAKKEKEKAEKIAAAKKRVRISPTRSTTLPRQLPLLRCTWI